MCKQNIRKDCKFYRNDTVFRGCIALKELVCRNEKCIFYKKIKKEKNNGPI